MKSLINKLKVTLIMFGLVSASVFGITDEETSKIESALPAKAVATPKQERSILVFSLCKGYVHSCIPYWKAALEKMGQKTGAFGVEFSEDMGVFTVENLKKYDAICFNNTTNLEPDESQQKAILDFIKSGKGIIGIHAATDSFYNWPDGMEMWGGKFTGHPWTGDGTWAVKIDEPGHLLMKSFKEKNFKINDEIYRTDAPLYSRSKQRVLMSLDLTDEATKNAKDVREDDWDTGISWIKRVGSGRLFYCSLGHNHHLTWNSEVLGHYLAGIQYALGDYDVDDAPVVSALNSGELDGIISSLKSYDWDKDRAPVAKLELYIRENSDSVENRKAIESKLLKVLGEKVSLAVKDAVCRELSVIGTEASADTLLKMLDKKEEANLALYALQRIQGKKIDDGLLEKFKDSSGLDQNTYFGVVSALGNRRCEGAVSELKHMFYATSIDTGVDKYIAAIAKIGSPESIEILKDVKANDALLSCAQNMCKEGRKAEAIEIYKGIYSSKASSIVRAAALAGLIDAGYDERILVEAITGSDAVVQSMAASRIKYVSDRSVLKSLIAVMPTMPDEIKVQMFAGLGANENKVGSGHIEKIVSQSDSYAVKFAGYRALGEIGNGETAIKLAEFAAKASDRNERNVIQESLYRLNGEDVDKTIVRAIAGGKIGDNDVVVELIKAAAERPIPAACGVLIKMARSDNRRVSSESMKVLQELVGVDHMADAIDMLVEMPSSATENIVVAAYERVGADAVDMMVAKYPTVANEKAKVSMLKVMGRISDAKFAGFLKKEFESGNEAVSEGAFRGMTEWKDGEFLDQMKMLAVSGKDEKVKILALRAYIDMIVNVYGNADQTKAVDMLIEAFGMAERADEKKIIINLFSNAKDAKTLEFVKGCMSDPELKAEAEVAAKKIEEKMK